MGRVGILRVVLALVAWAGFSAFALADDWMVDRLRGEVLVMTHGAWTPLRRGDIVSDSSRIRSAEGSRVTFTRGAEAIELDGATEIRIFDQQGERMTTIMQAYGSVTVEAERLQIQHFSVQTPFLAAIVKGTRFTVRSDDSQSSVDVARGLVQVQDYTHGVATDIAPGQSAVVSNDIVLNVSGGGVHAPMVTLDGQLVPPGSERPAAAQASGQQANLGNGHAQGPNDANGHGNAHAASGNSGNGNSGNANNGNGGNSGGNNGNSGNAGGNNGNGGNSGNAGNGGGNNGNGGNAGNGNGNSSNGDNGNHGNSNNGQGKGKESK